MADDLGKLAADLGKVARSAGKDLRAAVEVTARKIKDETRDAYKGSDHLPGAARSITYELKGLGAVTGVGKNIGAEIGPSIGGQGSIVGLVEEGTPRVAARHRLLKALEQNASDFEEGVAKATTRALKEHGL